MFGETIMDRYWNNANPQRIANLIRGFEFFSKIGYNFVSPIVNLTQLMVNTGTSKSIPSLRWAAFLIF